jgi:hypothetical protein
MNTPTSEDVNEFIIEQFKTLHKECDAPRQHQILPAQIFRSG